MNLPRSTKAGPSASRRFARRLFVFGGACLVLAASWAESSSAWAEAPAAFVVVVNARNPIAEADREFLADVFLKKVSRWGDGESVRPVDLRPDSPTRRDFSQRVLRRPIAAIRSYWQQCIFSGRDVPPPELDSDAAVLRYVAKQRGGVGYVSASVALSADVKVIAVR